jgi:transposase InsO family protein
MVEEMSKENLEVELTCRTLEISRSGYYAWLQEPEAKREQENNLLKAEIQSIHEKSRGTYGVPRVSEVLKAGGKKLGKNRVARLMKVQGLAGVGKKKFKVKTTDSNHDLPIAPRLVQTENKETLPTKPNEAWGSDITYINTKEGWLFLAIFLDLFTRKVVGMAMEEHMRAELVLGALESALGREVIKKNGLTAHSDRGSQFASEEYRKKLKLKGIIASMSRKGNCYDNAFVESFFHTLKTELIYRTEFETREEAKKAIFEFIEVWYNRERLHSSLGYKSPEEFERLAMAS